jgi:hypothetical protein
MAALVERHIAGDQRRVILTQNAALLSEPNDLCLRFFGPLRVDSVEKVLAAVGTKFLRAADAFKAVRHGGPRRLEQKLSAIFFFA